MGLRLFSESHPLHPLTMNTTKLGLKALLAAVVVTVGTTFSLPTFGQSTIQTKKAASPTICYLSLRGTFRYSGPCTLSLKTDGVRTWYSVDMNNFSTTFVRQGEGLYANEINGGSFKAIPVDRGGSLIVNWNFNNIIISRDCTSGCKLPLQGVPGRTVSAIMDSFFGA